MEQDSKGFRVHSGRVFLHASAKLSPNLIFCSFPPQPKGTVPTRFRQISNFVPFHLHGWKAFRQFRFPHPSRFRTYIDFVPFCIHGSAYICDACAYYYAYFVPCSLPLLQTKFRYDFVFPRFVPPTPLFFLVPFLHATFHWFSAMPCLVFTEQHPWTGKKTIAIILDYEIV